MFRIHDRSLERQRQAHQLTQLRDIIWQEDVPLEFTHVTRQVNLSDSESDDEPDPLVDTSDEEEAPIRDAEESSSSFDSDDDEPFSAPTTTDNPLGEKKQCEMCSHKTCICDTLRPAEFKRGTFLPSDPTMTLSFERSQLW